MSLFAYILVFSLSLVLAGGLLASAAPAVLTALRRLPRSRTAAVVTLAIGGGGFLWNVSQLGEADFGAYRWLIFGISVFVGIMSFWHAPDFLAVRGATIVYMLFASLLLEAGFMRYDPGLLFVKGLVYAGIFASLWLAVSPFRARDAIEWLTHPGETWRVRAVGLTLCLAGLASGAVGFMR